MITAGERARDLIGKMLAFSRDTPRETGASMDVAALVREVTTLLASVIPSSITIAVDVANQVPRVQLGATDLHQVLVNLAVNARDAMGESGRLDIAVAATRRDHDVCVTCHEIIDGDYVEIVCRDTGSGMDEALMKRIFEPFFTTKEEGKGTGLGLATVYGIVKQTNGFLRVESTPGMGSTFYVYLPRYQGEVESMDTTPKPLAARGVETILIVEDEALILTLTRKALARQGYQVLCAESPTEACRICEEHSGAIDLLLSDLIMPEMNGRELSHRIHAMRPGIRTIFMSGYTADLIASQGVLEEGVEFLQKPFPMETLAAKVREVPDRP